MQQQRPQTQVWPPNFTKAAERKAASFVCAEGVNEKTGETSPLGWVFHERFDQHPWVRQSILEGWDGELRGYIRQQVTQRILTNEPFADIALLMPSRHWVEEARRCARGYRDGMEFRNRVEKSHGSLEKFLAEKKPVYQRGQKLGEVR